MNKIIIFFAAASLLLLQACERNSAELQQLGHQSVLGICPGFEETGKAPLVNGAECGELKVKENPQDSNSRVIALNILRLPAISPAPDKDPVFLIQGGPGGSSVEMAKQIHAAFQDVRKNRDLIFVDQRGTGKSNPMKCKTPPENLKQMAEELQEEWADNEIKRCAEEFKDTGKFYTTSYAVGDLEKVRVTLGYESINLWGGSYGTRVAMEYAREYPQHLRSMVLDGVAPVELALPDYFARDAMQSLIKINEQCVKDEECFALYGNMLDKISIILARLEKAEAEDKPIAINYINSQNNQVETSRLNSKEFSGLIFLALYSRDLSALFPQIISDAEKERYQALIGLNNLSTKSFNQLNVSDAMRYSVVCNEDRHVLNPHSDELPKMFLASSFAKDMDKVCAVWPKANVSESYFQPLKTDVPSLLLSGGFDPVTPELWAKSASLHMSNSLSLVAPGGHHIVSMEGCVPQLIAQFYERGSVKNLNADCITDILPLPTNLGANRNKKSKEDEQ